MNKYLTELHLHTKESSSCSKIPARKMIEIKNMNLEHGKQNIEETF